MKHVGLNLVFLVPGETGGMEVAARQLIPALRDAAPAVRFTAFVNREAAGEDFGVEQVVVPVDATSRVQWVLGEQLHLPRLARRAGCDLVHSLGSTAPGHGAFRRIVTVWDLNYLVVPDAHFGLRGLGMRVLIPLAVRGSHRVLTASESTRRDLVERLGAPPEKVTTVPSGFGQPARATRTAAVDLRARYDLRNRQVLLTLSAKRPHKNLAGLLDALARIPAERRPVAILLGYPTPYEAELRERAQRLGLTGDVRFPGWTNAADVEGLFAVADAFVFPSFYEGVGLPPLEAMARGVPVACSNRASLPEYVGDAALLFDPSDPSAIARAVERVLTDPGDLVERGRAQVARFSWERSARATLEAYSA